MSQFTLNYIRAYHTLGEQGCDRLYHWLKLFEDAGRLTETKPCPSIFPWSVVRVKLPAGYDCNDARQILEMFGVPSGCVRYSEATKAVKPSVVWSKTGTAETLRQRIIEEVPTLLFDGVRNRITVTIEQEEVTL